MSPRSRHAFIIASRASKDVVYPLGLAESPPPMAPSEHTLQLAEVVDPAQLEAQRRAAKEADASRRIFESSVLRVFFFLLVLGVVYFPYP